MINRSIVHSSLTFTIGLFCVVVCSAPNAGVGAGGSGADPTPDDDEFTAYKKRMALSYRFRPNPLNNPRKQYY